MSDERIEIKRTGRDVIGAGLSGDGNIVGKEITVQNNVIQLVNPSPEAIAALNKIDAVSTAVAHGNAGGLQGGRTTEDTPGLQRSIDELLSLLKHNSNRVGEPPKEIQAGTVHFSRVDLLLKKAVLIKTEAEQMYFDHLAKVKPRLEREKQPTADGRFQLNLDSVMQDFDQTTQTAKFQEAYKLLQEANQLDPTNTEVLLNLAQLLIQLTPDDPSDEQRLLYRVQRLIAAPQDDAERFRLAQATFLLATLSEPYNVESLRDAREMFEKLGRREWVRHCDDILAKTEGSRTGPGAIPPRIPTSPATAPAPPSFQPIGRWRFQITDATQSVMTVDFYPNATFNAIQQAGPFGPSIQAQGQWLFNPYTQTVQFQGLVNGFMPFMLGVAIQGAHPDGFYGIGSDNFSYYITRA